jgi:hypothetical protein
MSDQEQQEYGQEALERRTWGAEPVHPDTPPEDVLSESEAAERIAEPRPEERPTIERDYIRRDKPARNEDGTFATQDGVQLFEREPSRNWVTAEEAGKDLAATRQAESDYLKNQEAEQIRKATDELRSEQPQQQGESVEQWAARLQQQPSPGEINDAARGSMQPPTNQQVIDQLSAAVSQLDTAISSEQDLQTLQLYQTKRAELATHLEQARYRAAFEQFPELTHSIENEINQRTQQYQAQVAIASAQAQQSAQAALAATAARFPELQGINTIPELQLALNVMAQSNPERFEAARRDLSYVVAAAQNAQQIGAQHAQNQAAQFEAYAKQQDELYDQAHPEMKDPAVSARVSKSAMDYLKNNIGLSDDDVRAVWNSPQGRSAAFQNILHDAVMYSNAKAAVPRAKANPVRQVQRPGSPVERAPDSDLGLVALDRRLSESGNVKDARDLLIALRGRR